MRKILLQHWNGTPTPLARISWDQMREYAQRVGAVYQLLIGTPFDPRLSNYAQKLALFDEQFDDYDTVVMVDSDEIPAKGLTKDLFTVEGNGWHQARSHRRVCHYFPTLTSPHVPFWGGAVYRFERELRQQLRPFLRHPEAWKFDVNITYGYDEGILHRAAVLAGLQSTSPHQYYFGKVWCQDNDEPNPEMACFFHIRAHPSKDKYENYLSLVKRGFVK